MTPVPLEPSQYPAAVPFKAAWLPRSWPLSVIEQIDYYKYASTLRFFGRMSKSQLSDLLALNDRPGYAKAVNELFTKSEIATRWSVKDWLRSGEYIEKWDGRHKSIKHFALLRSQDAKEFVVLCPTFVDEPIVIRICQYGDLHVASKASCKFCRCPIETRLHDNIHRKLRVCFGCWTTLLSTVDDIDKEINSALKTKAVKKHGNW